MKRLVAVMLCLAMTTTGCAAARAQVSAQPTNLAQAAVDPALMAAYISQLPLGARVRVSLADGRVIRGTLMRAHTDPIVVQRRTRIPEPPVQIPIRDVQALELETKNGGGTARAIALGAAAGAASTLGMLMLLVAIFAD